MKKTEIEIEIIEDNKNKAVTMKYMSNTFPRTKQITMLENTSKIKE